MTDDLLARLDESLGAVRDGLVPAPAGARHRGAAAAASRTIPAPVPVARVSIRDRWPWVEWFICAQFLWGALLFIPGAQPYRPIIRALPYASSLGMLVLYFPQRSTWTKAPGSASFMLAALGVLVANLLHPTTQFAAGVAQCVFQLMIAAPVFWAWKAVRDETRLLKVIRLVFVLNVLSASVGALQVYLPEDEPGRSTRARALARRLASLSLLIAEINGIPAADHPLAPYLVEAGFHPSAMGYLMARRPPAGERQTLGPRRSA